MGKKQKSLKHVFTDGSAFKSEGRFGAGWVIAGEDAAVKKTGSSRLALPRNSSSSLAEICAVTMGLNDVKKSARIILHCDDANLCRQIGKNIFGKNLKGKKRVALEQPYADLFYAVSRHNEVTVVHTNDRESTHMKQAHHLAQAGAKADLNGHPVIKGEEKIKVRKILYSFEALSFTDLELSLVLG